MFKRGEAKVPLDKVPILARALNVDPALLFCLAVEQYWPGGAEAVARIFGCQSQPAAGAPEGDDQRVEGPSQLVTPGGRLVFLCRRRSG